MDMSQTKVTPLKVGLLAVVFAYFLFNVHSMFNLNWVGEWNRLTTNASTRFVIYITDVTGAVGIAFRLAASIIALAAVVYYFNHRAPSRERTFKILRIVVLFEGIYWLGLATTAYYGFQSFFTVISQSGLSTTSFFYDLMVLALPTAVEGIILPIVLFILAFKLSPTKPTDKAIKWSLIAGTIIILVFWLVYTSIWITILYSSPNLITGYTQNLVSFILTAFGLLALTIYAAYFATVSRNVRTLEELKLKVAATIILLLGLFFLWNYVSWLFFGVGPWNEWGQMFLGHDLDIWMLSLPLLAIPLLSINRLTKQDTEEP